MSENRIRTAAKAIIIKDNKILLAKHFNINVFYTLPGGGQNHNETLDNTLKRECLEEIGAEIEIVEAAFISEYRADTHDSKFHLKGFHQVDIFFICNLIKGPDMTMASEVDTTQIGYEWIDIEVLKETVLYPMDIRSKIYDHHNQLQTMVYLGDVE